MSRFGKDANDISNRLNGRKILIKGNHDRYLKDKEFDFSLFEEIADYKEFNDNRRKVVCSHYPMFCYNGQYRLNEDGSPKTYMLYGYVHNTYDEHLVDCFIKETRNTKRCVYGKGDIEIPCNMINCFLYVFRLCAFDIR